MHARSSVSLSAHSNCCCRPYATAHLPIPYAEPEPADLHAHGTYFGRLIILNSPFKYFPGKAIDLWLRNEKKQSITQRTRQPVSTGVFFVLSECSVPFMNSKTIREYDVVLWRFNRHRHGTSEWLMASTCGELTSTQQVVHLGSHQLQLVAPG